MPSVNDVKLTNLRTKLAKTTGSVVDNEYAFFSANSGLPAARSLSDHKIAYYKLKGAVGSSVDDLELSFMRAQGASGASADSVYFDFYTNHVFI